MDNETLDNILENQDKKITETNQLLENVLENGDDNAKKLQKKTEEGSDKLSEAIKELKPAIGAAGFIEGFLKEIKGDEGIKGNTGEKGDSIKGDKGDSVKGDKGNDGEKGDKGDTVKGEDGKDGSDGIDGSDGKNGTDGEKGKDGKDADIKEVIKVLEKRKISYKDLKDIPDIYKGKLMGAGYLKEITDIEILDEPVNGQALVYDSTKKQWKPTTLSSSVTNVYSETPTGTINGSNKVFTLANTPTTDSLQLYLNGAFQTGGGEDYTIAGDTITFINAPLTGSVLKAFYNY